VTLAAAATYKARMKRWSLPASALVLVLIACGAGTKSAPQVTAVKSRVPSVRVLAARRERTARREAKTLLREFVAPREARRIQEPRNYAGVLRQSGPQPIGELVDVHRFWSVRKPLEAVTAFLRAHRLRGFEQSVASRGNQKPPHYIVMSSRAGDRYLNVTSVGLPRRTLIRVDAQVEWVYPRSPGEKVPAATSEIDVRAPRASADVTNQAKVARIVRWFDALTIAPPGIVVSCPLGVAPDIRLSFRDAHGDRLAQAAIPPSFAWICDSISFTIGGAQQKPLIDRLHRPSFALRLQRLLGVHLVRIRR
jgi:hypothetical protein